MTRDGLVFQLVRDGAGLRWLRLTAARRGLAPFVPPSGISNPRFATRMLSRPATALQK